MGAGTRNFVHDPDGVSSPGWGGELCQFHLTSGNLMRDEAGGDPISGVLWTHRSMRALSDALARQHHHASTPVVRHLLRARGYALRVNRKRLARAQSPEGDAQCRRLRRTRRAYLRRGEPVISVDTKKRELVGPFKNQGLSM